MKTFIYLCITSVIGTGAFLTALNMSNPYPAFIVGFGIWGLFIWGVIKRSEEARKRKHRERMFDEWLYQQHKYKKP